MSYSLVAMRASTLRIILVVIGICLVGPAQATRFLADPEICGFEPGPIVEVVKVIDGNTVRISDGRELRISGIRAPGPPLGRKNAREFPYAVQAKDLLKRIGGGDFQIFYNGGRIDRHGRIIGHLFARPYVIEDQELTIAGALVSAIMLYHGMARVDDPASYKNCYRSMYRWEESAREMERGIWADPFYQIRKADKVEADIDSFQLVEGKVLSAASTRSGMYLNFGRSWRTDFTILIAPPYFGPFEGAGFDPLALEGRYIRVRGWITEENGPMIRATHPSQIEILSQE